MEVTVTINSVIPISASAKIAGPRSARLRFDFLNLDRFASPIISDPPWEKDRVQLYAPEFSGALFPGRGFLLPFDIVSQLLQNFFQRGGAIVNKSLAGAHFVIFLGADFGNVSAAGLITQKLAADEGAVDRDGDLTARILDAEIVGVGSTLGQGEDHKEKIQICFPGR